MMNSAILRNTCRLCFLGVFLTNVTSAFAAKPSASERTHQLVETLKRNAPAPDQPPSSATQAETEKQLDDLFDFDRLTDVTLAVHKQAFKAEQFKEFRSLFRQLIRGKALDAGQAFNAGEVSFGDEKTVAKQRQVAVHVSNPEKDIDSDITFVWEDEGSSWRVVDVHLDGASVVRDYQNQFGRIIKKESAQALINKIKNRLNQQEARKTP